MIPAENARWECPAATKMATSACGNYFGSIQQKTSCQGNYGSEAVYFPEEHCICPRRFQKVDLGRCGGQQVMPLAHLDIYPIMCVEPWHRVQPSLRRRLCIPGALANQHSAIHRPQRSAKNICHPHRWLIACFSNGIHSTCLRCCRQARVDETRQRLQKEL